MHKVEFCVFEKNWTHFENALFQCEIEAFVVIEQIDNPPQRVYEVEFDSVRAAVSFGIEYGMRKDNT